MKDSTENILEINNEDYKTYNEYTDDIITDSTSFVISNVDYQQTICNVSKGCDVNINLDLQKIERMRLIRMLNEEL